MNESVVERSLDVADAKDVLGVLAWGGGRGTIVDDLLLLLDVSSLLCSLGLKKMKKNQVRIRMSKLNMIK